MKHQQRYGITLKNLLLLIAVAFVFILMVLTDKFPGVEEILTNILDMINALWDIFGVILLVCYCVYRANNRLVNRLIDRFIERLIGLVERLF